MVYVFLRFLAFIIFKAVFRIRVTGEKYIPKDGGFILASNHISYLDPIALGVACPRKLNYMARHDLFLNQWFSRLLYSVRTFPVKRGHADLSAIKEAINKLRRGEPLVLFPEGSRRLEGLSSQPLPGIGFLANKANVTVIPAFVKGTDKALPKGAKFILPAKIYVYFGKQILIERRMPYQEAADLVMESIRRLSCCYR